MFRVDLHTHSDASPDGGITEAEYMQLVGEDTLDYIAVTDHDTIHMAQHLHKTLGEKIIIGEEITTREGEIIGLYLKEEVPAGLTAEETAKRIKKQGGLVYIPHPFETVRKGITEQTLDEIKDLVDIVEVYNGRAVMQNKGPKATVWARLNHKVTAASSDAHGMKGVGTAYTTLKEPPTKNILVAQLATGHMNMKRPPIHTLLYPKRNRLKRALRKHQ